MKIKSKEKINQSCIMTGTLTEFEESLSFDVDDPDFASPHNSQTLINTMKNNNRGIFQVDCLPNINILSTLSNQSKKMSVTSVEASAENLSRQGSDNSLKCLSRSDSFETLQGSHPQYQDTVVTIEELRAQLNSCFTCGVSWIEKHVSLDCSECGGYSLERPCPVCDGRCHVTWKRNLTGSHASRKARWTGKCGLSCNPSHEETLVPALEKLRATS